jgi:hypothetical protein
MKTSCVSLTNKQCGGEVPHPHSSTSRTKYPMQHHVALHRRCQLFLHVSRETPDATPLSHLTAAGSTAQEAREGGWAKSKHQRENGSLVSVGKAVVPPLVCLI